MSWSFLVFRRMVSLRVKMVSSFCFEGMFSCGEETFLMMKEV
jgi:hypothetical protein